MLPRYIAQLAPNSCVRDAITQRQPKLYSHSFCFSNRTLILMHVFGIPCIVVCLPTGHYLVLHVLIFSGGLRTFPGLTVIDRAEVRHAHGLSPFAHEKEMACTTWASLMLSDVSLHSGSSICSQPTMHQCFCFLTDLPTSFLATALSWLRIGTFLIYLLSNGLDLL